MIAEAENSTGLPTQFAVKKTYGRKKRRPAALPSKIEKRRESNASLSSFFPHQTTNCHLNVHFSPFKSLQKYLRAGISAAEMASQNVFDLVPTTSPVQINALSRPSRATTSKGQAKRKVVTQLAKAISGEPNSPAVVSLEPCPQNRSAKKLSISEPLLKGQQAFSPEHAIELSPSANFLKENFCLSNSMEENPFLESTFLSNAKRPEAEPVLKRYPEAEPVLKRYPDATKATTKDISNLSPPKEISNVFSPEVSTKPMCLNEPPLLSTLLLNACDQEHVLDFNFFMEEFKYFAFLMG
ncbi:hypothetical protein DI09_89p100 [Mitosporidium daphniae]|uniref:Uncharacterized protein n=1 Tax=Mitosporidium daphniae TaxID=1485682 RepID=A0A098VQT8_9MICR|nr:uncharacterized protein DI09_89p100 [Mitosporidium daphniae]KGG50116.1 hypothetical protein DI09_89p100 [Mitosporidium daphniae]|eukprot:XP_013236552.1 uncharacterized protein DI09_89p100 [Mitosporidium daphniae]